MAFGRHTRREDAVGDARPLGTLLTNELIYFHLCVGAIVPLRHAIRARHAMTRTPQTTTPLMNRLLVLATGALLVALGVGCGASAQMQAPSMEAMPMAQQAMPAAPLTENHFRTDRTTNITEAQLKEILEAPVLLEDMTRVGIVPVATAYEVDNGVPVDSVPQHLSAAMERTGFFDVTTEIATDWPANGSISGLRELAARYRVKYLMLYRHRFVDAEHTNGWAWTWPTVVGLLFAPSQTIQAAGVMEASLFDVRTGTILFTVFHRVAGDTDENVWRNEAKLRDLKEELLIEGTTKLADEMLNKLRRLAANSQAYREEVAAATRKMEHVRRESERAKVKPLSKDAGEGAVTPMSEGKQQ